MSGYLRALTRLRLREDFNVLCPGHGPLVWDAHAKLEEYVAHRIDRENSLIVALGEGHRSVQDLLATRLVRTCPSRCAAPPRSRSRRTWTSSRKSRYCRAGWSVRGSKGANGERRGHALLATGQRRPACGRAPGDARDPAGLAFPADRRLRLPVGLPHRRARRLRRVDRVDVPAPLRLAVGVRCDARPRRGQLAGGPLRRSTSPPGGATSPART